MASSRTLPPGRCCRNSPTGADTEEIWPPINSSTAGWLPRYGIWRNSTPPARDSNSPRKCGTEPGAGEPKFPCAGFFFTHARNSATFVTDAGTAGPTARPKSTSMRATVASGPRPDRTEASCRCGGSHQHRSWRHKDRTAVIGHPLDGLYGDCPPAPARFSNIATLIPTAELFTHAARDGVGSTAGAKPTMIFRLSTCSAARAGSERPVSPRPALAPADEMNCLRLMVCIGLSFGRIWTIQLSALTIAVAEAGELSSPLSAPGVDGSCFMTLSLIQLPSWTLRRHPTLINRIIFGNH